VSGLTVQVFSHANSLHRRLVGTVVISAATYGLARYLGLEVEIEEVEQSSQDGWEVAGPEADGDDEEDDDDAILFLPTGLSRPRQRTFYKGSDSEWQTFKKIATDRSRADKIRSKHDLVQK
jgi:hypothetical protein